MSKDKEFIDILKVEGVNAKGFGIIPKLVMQDRRLTRDAKAIYAYFKSFAGAGNTAFPSIKKICYDLGFGKEETYRKHFNLLKKYDYIKVQQERNKKGRWGRNIYTLIERPNPPEIVENTENPPHPQKEGIGKKMEDLPYPQKEGHRENGTPVKVGTKNNSIKINNILENNQSVSLDRQADDEKELNTIMENSNVDLFNDKKIKNLIIEAISKLYYSKSIKNGDIIIDQEKIRSELKKINVDILDYTINKYIPISADIEIKNKFKYFQILLFNAISECNADTIAI